MEQSLKLAGKLRANQAAMARALRVVVVDDAEVDSVLNRTPEQIAEWMVANNDRQISRRHFWKLAGNRSGLHRVGETIHFAVGAQPDRRNTMRTQEEIAAKVTETRAEFFNFTPEVLMPYLDFGHARPFLKPEATHEEWEKCRLSLDRDAIVAKLRDYMAFAWEKVEDHRGLSAGRSVDKTSAYVWLLGDEATCAAIEEAGYAQYGAPKLAVICKAYGLPIPQSAEVARMIRGLPCFDGCDGGCGDDSDDEGDGAGVAVVADV